MLFPRDPRFDAIKPMLNGGKIRVFSDIFIYIKITAVSRVLGKRTTRFKELISNVEDFYIKELFLLARKFDLTAEEILDLVAHQITTFAFTDNVLFPTIPALVREGRIHVLADIIPYIEISKLARPLGRSSTRLKELMENVEDLQVKKVLLLGGYCGLTKTEVFGLVAAQAGKKTYYVQNKK